MPETVLSDYGLRIRIKDEVHEIEFQDFNLLEFSLDPESKKGKILLEYDDTDPASIKAEFTIESWNTLANPRQVKDIEAWELLFLGIENDDLVMDVKSAAGIQRIVLKNAKWTESVSVE